MTTAVQTLLESFDRLSLPEQWTLLILLLRRTLHLDFPPLADDELLFAADDVFANLDREEADA